MHCICTLIYHNWLQNYKNILKHASIRIEKKQKYLHISKKSSNFACKIANNKLLCQGKSEEPIKIDPLLVLVR